MRFPFWLLLASSALAGCGGPSLEEGKPTKAASLTGKQEVRLRLAHATEEGGDLEGAEKAFQQVAQQSPSSPAAQLELAEFYRRHHADDRAISGLNAAHSLDPNNTDIDRELANVYIGTGEPEKGLALLDSALEINRKDPLLYNSKGVALDQMGNYSEAQRNYKTAYDLDPIGGITYKINISMSYILAGQYDKAIALLQPMLNGPDAPPIIRQNLALAYGMKGENESALKLGLQDLTNSEAEENVRFYRMLAHKHGTGVSHFKTPSAVSSLPAADIGDLFPEHASPAPVAEAPTPVPVNMPHEEEAVQAVPVMPVHVADQKEVPHSIPKETLANIPSQDDSADEKEDSPVRDSAVLPQDTDFPAPVLKPDSH